MEKRCANCKHCDHEYRCAYWEFGYTDYDHVYHGGVKFAPLTCLFIEEPFDSCCDNWEVGYSRGTID